MSEKIFQALDNRFENHRLVFWYDENAENLDAFDGYKNDNIVKLILDNDEFALKHRMLIEQPEKQFLVYSIKKRPMDRNNWLLDLNLSECVFAADQTALRLEELEISMTYRPLIEQHISFFQNEKERRLPFKRLLPVDADAEQFKLIMLSVTCSKSKSEHELVKDIKDIIISVITSQDSDENKLLDDIDKFSLTDFFWQQVEAECGFKADSPDITSLIVYLFKNGLDFETVANKYNIKPTLRKVYSFIDYWRNNFTYSSSYKEAVLVYEEKLNVEHQLSGIELKELVELDIFKITDNLIVSLVAKQLLADRIDLKEALSMILRRRETWWYRTTGEDLLINNYQAVEHFIKFRIELKNFNAVGISFDRLWHQYQSQWHILDTYYRKFLFYFNNTGGSTNLTPLVNMLEKQYENVFLKELESSWHNQIELKTIFSDFENISQNHFFKQNIKSMLSADKQLFVIASDALRYEAGAELSSKLERIKGVKVELDSRLSVIPSITAAGMAALMPNNEIEIIDDGTFRVDKMPEAGIENRNNIVRKNLPEMMPGKLGVVLKADDFMKRTKEEQMDDIKGYDVVYLFSNRIDSVADNAKTENALPTAVEDELEFITSIVKKLTMTHRRKHVIITADHGFMYQSAEVHESAMIALDDAEPVKKDRRWAYGNFPDNPQFHNCKPEEVGFTGNMDLRFPKGPARIRKQGGGTRYVHGGVSIQELIVPLITVNQTREDDLRMVELISLITSPHITSNQFAFKLMQEEPVAGKVLPRTIIAVLEADDGTILSDQHELIFDISLPAEQERSRTIRFDLNADASRYNNRTVKVMLYTKIEGGEKAYYRHHDYKLNKAIEKDF